jgi:hypothetical protein
MLSSSSPYNAVSSMIGRFSLSLGIWKFRRRSALNGLT